MFPRTHRQRLLSLALLLGGLVVPPTAAAQQLRAAPKQPQASLPPSNLWGRPNMTSPKLPQDVALSAVAEIEPNDSSLIATPAALGDTIWGVIDPIGDVDFFAINFTAGTEVLLDVDASQYGSSLDPILGLFDVDGHTLLAYNDDTDGLDSEIIFTIPATGRYYVGIMDFSAGGGPSYFYNLKILSYVPPPPLPPGPGDPTVPFAQGLGLPLGIAAAPGGSFFVADYEGHAVLRVSASGSVSRFATVPGAIDLAIDSYGNLLVAAQDSGVYRLDGAGARSAFLTGFFADAIAIDATGDVWLGGYNQNWDAEIRRLDAHGALKATIDVNSIGGVADLAFSPSGILFATNGHYGVYQISPSGATPVNLSTPLEYPEGIADTQARSTSMTRR